MTVTGARLGPDRFNRFSGSVLALVLAGGCGRRLGALTSGQTKAAVPFGGRYRAVDFVLSNCVNSELRRIALLTQYKSQSLIRHVYRGWGFLHRELGEYVEIWPAQQRDGERWYGGTVDALYQNLDLIEAAGPTDVLVLAGDQLYQLDYQPLIEQHRDTGAALTIACVEMPFAAAVELGVPLIEAGPQVDRIESVSSPRAPAARARRPATAFVPMGVHLFSAPFLRSQVEAWRARSPAADLAADLVPGAIGPAKVFAYVFRDDAAPGYWRDIGTIDRYWSAHVDLLAEPPGLRLSDPDWPVFTQQPSLGPVKIRAGADVETSLLGPGCTVSGKVVGSVLSGGCSVEEGAEVRDSVLLPGAHVGRGCKLERVVVDGGCRIAPRTALGFAFGTDFGHYVSPGGVTLVTGVAGRSSPYTARKIA